MPSVNDFAAKGKILSVSDGIVVFNPAGTNYELRLEARGDMSAAPLNVPIEGFIRVVARKVWSVQSGGNFISPIFGPPRTLQGRIRLLEGDEMVLHASMPIIISLPLDDAVYDLNNGPLKVNGLANVAAAPGATFELATKPAAVVVG
jgi:hypothetical protein